MASFRLDLEKIVPVELCTLLDQRDGAALLIPKLRAGIDPIGQETIWDYCALYYSSQGRYHEALSIYHALYDALMGLQEALESKARVHKGTPLVRIADAYSNLGCPLLAKRYMMLTMCEDALSLAGNIPAETTGTYFRLVWQYGIPHEQLNRYAKRAWEVACSNLKESRFPEWILQELDQAWMREYTSSKEAATFI